MGAGSKIVVLGKQPAQRRLETEHAEHMTGNVLEIRFFGLLVRCVGQIYALGPGDSDQLGLVFHGGAHQLKERVLCAVECSGDAAEAQSLARGDVQTISASDWQRTEKQRIDESEGGYACTDGERER